MKSHLLIIGKVWPEPTSSAAGSRMMQLIDAFKKLDWKITFACAANKTPYSEDLSQLNIETVDIKLNDASFDDFIVALNPKVVLFDRYMTEEQFGWRVAEKCPNTIRILDTEDIHSLRYARQKAVEENRKFSEEDLVSDYSVREIASILRCDLSLIISSYEMELLKNFFKVDESLLHYIPFMLEPINNNLINEWPPFEERQNFITIGNFLHEPNWDSVLFLKKEIWPLIRTALPEAEINIYGAYPSQKVIELNDPRKGFLIKGKTEDVKQVMQKAKVCLAPLRFGAGLKGKLIDAMMTGTPSVTTFIGAEGMHKYLQWSGHITDNPEEFAKAAINLYTNIRDWKTAQRNGIAIINTCYPKKKNEELLVSRLNHLQQNIKEHRLHNFMGTMLMHHSLSSTKYMSKWIEEKNRYSNQRTDDPS